MIATVSMPIDLNRHRAPASAVAARAPQRVATPGLNVSRPIEPWRWRAALVNAFELVAVVWSIPLVIVAIGAPLALAIVALLWLARRVLGAF